MLAYLVGCEQKTEVPLLPDECFPVALSPDELPVEEDCLLPRFLGKVGEGYALVGLGGAAEGRPPAGLHLHNTKPSDNSIIKHHPPD